MAQTLYSKILQEWYWDKISAAMDYGASLHRNGLQELREDQPADELVSEGSYNDIPFWAGNREADGPDGFSVNVYIGSTFSLMPSGKYWTFWTTNQTAEDVRRDIAFAAAFEKACNKYGISWEAGDGDPTDQYLVRYYEWE